MTSRHAFPSFPSNCSTHLHILLYEKEFQFEDGQLIRRNRADFNDVHNYEEYLCGYRILRCFFAEHL
jgi:hypothetical protein